MEIDHLTVPVGEYVSARRFYEAALRPLGFRILLDWPDRARAYLGVPGRPSSLWLAESGAAGTLEVSFWAADREAVDAFHAAALRAGGASEDEPGIRAEYNSDTYAARIRDHDGNSIEAVCRGTRPARIERGRLAA